MDSVRPQRKILRSPSVKRKSKALPVNQRVHLERVLGETVVTNAGLSCDSNNGTIAYPAGCITVLFNPRRNKQSHIFNACKKSVSAVSFSRDGKYLVTGETGHQPAVRIWDVEEKTQVAEFRGHKFGINCVTFSPNMKEVVSVGTQHDMMINVWNWKSGNKIASNKVSSKVCAIAFSEDGKCFVTVGTRHVRFWYLEERRSKINQTVPLMGRSGILGDQKDNFFCGVTPGQGSMSGRFFVITQSGLLCEINEKRLLDKWVELRTKSANCITAGTDHIFVGCAEGVVRVFSATSLNYLCSLPKPHHLGVEITTATSPKHMVNNREDAHYPDTKAIAFDDDHKKVTCIYNDSSVYIWDVHDLKRVGKAWSFLYHSGCIWALEVYPQLEDGREAMLPPGSFLTGSGDDTIRVWNLNTHMPENTTYKRNIYSNELLKIVYSDPALTHLCDVDYNPAGATDKTDTTYDGKNGVRSIRVSPDGADLASGDRNGNIRIYDMKYLSEKRTIEAHESDVMCLEYSHTKEGHFLATASRDRLLHVFDVEQNYGLVQTLGDHSSSITAVRFTDTDDKLRMISCGADKSILLRSAVAAPDFQFQLEHHLATKISLYDMVIDPTQKCLATACQDRNVRLYNISSHKEKKCYRGSAGDDGTLLRIHLDPSGSFAATTCTDKNVCILDFYTGELIATMCGHSEVITGVKFANDLKHIITVSADGCIFIWRLPSEMTNQIKARLVELGKEMRDTEYLRSDQLMMPNPVALDGSFFDGNLPVKSASLSHIPLPDDNSSVYDRDEVDNGDEDDMDMGRRKSQDILDDTASQASLDYRFSIGQLPNWAKAKFGEGGSEGSESSQEMAPPKGRWAQRVDHTVEFKSQLDLTSDDDTLTDRRRILASDTSLNHISEFRRETVILSKQLGKKDVPVIGDDYRASTGDLITSSIKPHNVAVSSGSDSFIKYHSGSPNTSGVAKKWSDRFSLLKGNSLDHDDTDELDTGSDTTEVIYPPTDLDSDAAYASFYRVFEPKKQKSKPNLLAGIANLDDGTVTSESTDPISLEEDDEEDSDNVAISNPTTPSDPEKEFLPWSSSKDDFVKENFEENFIPLETFAKSLDQLPGPSTGLKKTASDSLPFSPRLSLSARFMSRSAQKVSSGHASGPRQDNWFNRNKMEMTRAMDETRKSLLAMNLRSVSPDNSPEKEEPPSPPCQAHGSNMKSPDNQKSFSPFPSSAPIGFDTDDTKRDNSKTRSPSSSLRNSFGNISQSPLAKKINKEKERRKSATSSKAPDMTQMKPFESSSRQDIAPSKPRTRPSYFKPTQSSKNKVNKNDGGQDLSQTAPVPVSKRKSGRLPGRLSGGLASSKMSFYASSPNLFTADDASDEEEPENDPKMKGFSTSNLYSLADLSRSVPDVNDATDSTSETSSTSSGRPQRKTVFGAVAKITSRYAGGLTSDKDLMPPPSSTTLSKISSLKDSGAKSLPRASKLSGSDMTLDEAKSILMGKSGILVNKPADTTFTIAPAVGGALRKGNAPSNKRVSELVSGVSRSQASVPETEDSVFEPTPSQLAMAEEIELTANLLRHQAQANTISSLTSSNSHTLSNMEASPLDLPERDLSVSPKIQKQTQGSSQLAPTQSQSSFFPGTISSSSSSVGSKPSGSASSSVGCLEFESNVSQQFNLMDEDLEEEERKKSVRDRIAQYNHGRSPVSAPVPFKTPGRSSSPHRRVLPASPNAQCGLASETLESSRSFSDAGIGSGSEMDGSVQMANRKNGEFSQMPNPQSQKADRSKLSLPTIVAASSDQVSHCEVALDELRSQLGKLKHLLSQVDGRTDETSQKILSMMGQAFHEAQSVINELASKTPSTPGLIDASSQGLSSNKTFQSSSSSNIANGSHAGPSPGKKGDNPVQSLSSSSVNSSSLPTTEQLSVLSATKEMLQPLLSQLSQDLSEEVVRLVREKIESHV